MSNGPLTETTFSQWAFLFHYPIPFGYQTTIQLPIIWIPNKKKNGNQIIPWTECLVFGSPLHFWKIKNPEIGPITSKTSPKTARALHKAKRVGLNLLNPQNKLGSWHLIQTVTILGFFDTFYQNTVPPILFKGVYKKDFHSFNKQFVFILFGRK